jgi:hypothetical protein
MSKKKRRMDTLQFPLGWCSRKLIWKYSTHATSLLLHLVKVHSLSKTTNHPSFVKLQLPCLLLSAPQQHQVPLSVHWGLC